MRPTDNYCSNCGLQLIEKPVSVGRQIYIYAISLLLPPLGLVWTFKYIRSPQPRQKMVAIVALVLTVVATVVTVYLFMGFLQTLQAQVNSIGNMNLNGL